MSRFPLIDQYLGIQLDILISEIAPGETKIVESRRRLRCEQSYGYIYALFSIWFADGRVAVSVLPGAGDGVGKVLMEAAGSSFSFDPARIEPLSAAVDQGLARSGLPPVQRANEGWKYPDPNHFS
jgi:hypothetical protein